MSERKSVTREDLAAVLPHAGVGPMPVEDYNPDDWYRLYVEDYNPDDWYRLYADAIFDALPATPPASETVEAAWRGLIEAIDRPHAVTTVAFYRPRIEAAIRADETRDCQSRADNEYERGRAAALDEARAAVEGAMSNDGWQRKVNVVAAIDALREDAHKP